MKFKDGLQICVTKKNTHLSANVHLKLTLHTDLLDDNHSPRTFSSSCRIQTLKKFPKVMSNLQQNSAGQTRAIKSPVLHRG